MLSSLGCIHALYLSHLSRMSLASALMYYNISLFHASPPLPIGVISNDPWPD